MLNIVFSSWSSTTGKTDRIQSELESGFSIQKREVIGCPDLWDQFQILQPEVVDWNNEDDFLHTGPLSGLLRVVTTTNYRVILAVLKEAVM